MNDTIYKTFKLHADKKEIVGRGAELRQGEDRHVRFDTAGARTYQRSSYMGERLGYRGPGIEP